MRDLAFETVVEGVTLGVEVLFAVLLTVVGVAAEVAGVARIEAGVDPLAVWYVAVGCLALYAGAYVLGYRTVGAQFRA